VRPDLFESQRLVITQEPSLFVTGILQKLHDVICVRAEHVEPLIESKLPTAKSHDFH
jgi:error-prone DNA polymerase